MNCSTILWIFAKLKKDAKILEIGSGPGQATERYLKLINSFSGFHDLDNDKKKAVLETVADYINGNNGKIGVPQEVRLYMAKK